MVMKRGVVLINHEALNSFLKMKGYFLKNNQSVILFQKMYD